MIFYLVSTVILGWASLEKNAVLKMMSTSAFGHFPVPGNSSFASKLYYFVILVTILCLKNIFSVQECYIYEHKRTELDTLLVFFLIPE